MSEPVVPFLVKGVLWAGYVLPGMLLLLILYRVLEAPDMLGNLFRFEEGPEKEAHLSRYLLVFGSIFLAARFLYGVLSSDASDPWQLARDVQDTLKFTKGLDMEEAAGASGR